MVWQSLGVTLAFQLEAIGSIPRLLVTKIIGVEDVAQQRVLASFSPPVPAYLDALIILIGVCF